MRNDQNEKNGRLTLERYMRRAEGCCLQTIMRPSHLSVSLLYVATLFSLRLILIGFLLAPLLLASTPASVTSLYGGSPVRHGGDELIDR